MHNKVCPSHGGHDPTPIVTRSGRASKPPQRYGETEDGLKQREREDLITALDRSVVELQNSPARARDTLSVHLEPSIQEEDPQ